MFTHTPNEKREGVLSTKVSGKSPKKQNSKREYQSDPFPPSLSHEEWWKERPQQKSVGTDLSKLRTTWSRKDMVHHVLTRWRVIRRTLANDRDRVMVQFRLTLIALFGPIQSAEHDEASAVFVFVSSPFFFFYLLWIRKAAEKPPKNKMKINKNLFFKWFTNVKEDLSDLSRSPPIYLFLIWHFLLFFLFFFFIYIL